MKQLKKGFSLIQLIIVIAVAAILSAVAIGAYFGVTESAKHSKAETEALQVFKEIQLKTIGNFTIQDVNTKVSYTENGLQFNGIYDDISLDRFAKEIFGENNPAKFISNYVINAMIGVCIDWMDDGMKIPPRELAELCANVYINGSYKTKQLYATYE